MLIESRVAESFWLFSNTLPIGEKQSQRLIQAFGEDISKMLPELIQKFVQVCKTYPEEFEGYLDFISQSISYMKGESDKMPEIDVSDYNQMITQMRVQLGTYNKKT